MKPTRRNLIKYAPRSKRVVVAESWYPTREDGTVSVNFTGLRVPATDKEFRVSVWGDDDFGLERDFENPNEALQVFDRIQHLVTQEQLYSWGFNMA